MLRDISNSITYKKEIPFLWECEWCLVLTGVSVIIKTLRFLSQHYNIIIIISSCNTHTFYDKLFLYGNKDTNISI